jgi:hypothetical protein
MYHQYKLAIFITFICLLNGCASVPYEEQVTSANIKLGDAVHSFGKSLKIIRNKIKIPVATRERHDYKNLGQQWTSTLTGSLLPLYFMG